MKPQKFDLDRLRPLRGPHRAGFLGVRRQRTVSDRRRHRRGQDRPVRRHYVCPVRRNIGREQKNNDAAQRFRCARCRDLCGAYLHPPGPYLHGASLARPAARGQARQRHGQGARQGRAHPRAGRAGQRRIRCDRRRRQAAGHRRQTVCPGVDAGTERLYQAAQRAVRRACGHPAPYF